MPNGFTTEQVVEMIFEEVKSIHKKIDGMNDSIADINAHGCAQRANDVERLKGVERWVNRGIVVVIASLAATSVAFIKLFFFGK